MAAFKKYLMTHIRELDKLAPFALMILFFNKTIFINNYAHITHRYYL